MKYIKNLLTAGLTLAVAIAVSAQSPRKLDFGFNFAATAQHVDVDDDGYTYVAGLFENSETFGTFTLNSNGGTDVFVLQIDQTGAIIDAVSFGGPEFETVNDIHADENGTIYLVGTFMGSVDFDPNDVTDFIIDGSTIGSDGYVVNLNAELGFEWAGSIGGDGIENITGVATGPFPDYYVYITGMFSDGADLAPLDTETQIENTTGLSSFFVKVDHHGALQWTKTVSNGNEVYGTGVTVDFAGNPVFIGIYTGTVNINPDGTEDLTGVGDSDIFILKLNTLYWRIRIINQPA